MGDIRAVGYCDGSLPEAPDAPRILQVVQKEKEPGGCFSCKPGLPQLCTQRTKRSAECARSRAVSEATAVRWTAGPVFG